MTTTGATYTYDASNNHPDHLNTPRLIADDQQRILWRRGNTAPTLSEKIEF